MATLKEQIKALQGTIEAMGRENDELSNRLAQRNCDFDTLTTQLVAARQDATQSRALIARCIEEHSIALSSKQAQIEHWHRVAKERGMQILKLTGKSAVDKGQGVATGVVVSHRTVAMEAARKQAMETGESVPVKL
jgi:predicted RNase H-like nuclease (RuvC/YqgF family)